MMRLGQLIEWILGNQAEGMIITGKSNIYYHSGFRGSNGLLVIGKDGQKRLVTDFRYFTQGALQAPDWEILKQTGDLFTTIADFVNSRPGKWLFEEDFLTVKEYGNLPKNSEVTYESCNIDFFRQIKSDKEIERIKVAADIADQALAKVLEWMEPGRREIEVKAFFDYQMVSLGAEQTSFSTIVGSGPNGALPHAVPGERKFQKGDLVVLDFGAVYEGYCSDETRTISIGAASAEQKERYQLVLDAQLAALKAIRPGVMSLEVDRIARDIIADAGYGEYFGHGLGHSLGIDIHESPRFSPTFDSTRMVENMVMTVEPGIYIPEWGGIRIEDLVVVKSEGCEILSKTSKALLEI